MTSCAMTIRWQLRDVRKVFNQVDVNGESLD
jgi:hypothetical protein